jgi:hypothetical protein
MTRTLRSRQIGFVVFTLLLGTRISAAQNPHPCDDPRPNEWIDPDHPRPEAIIVVIPESFELGSCVDSSVATIRIFRNGTRLSVPVSVVPPNEKGYRFLSFLWSEREPGTLQIRFEELDANDRVVDAKVYLITFVAKPSSDVAPAQRPGNDQ